MDSKIQTEETVREHTERFGDRDTVEVFCCADSGIYKREKRDIHCVEIWGESGVDISATRISGRGDISYRQSEGTRKLYANINRISKPTI